MKRNVAFFILAQTFFYSCNNTTTPTRFLYPSEKSLEVHYLCRLPYADASATHQAWKKSTPAWIFLNDTKVIVYSNNDRTFVFPRTQEITLPPGKYRCTV